MIFLKIRDIQYEKASRKDFAKVGDFIEMPNLIKVQKDSYDTQVNSFKKFRGKFINVFIVSEDPYQGRIKGM